MSRDTAIIIALVVFGTAALAGLFAVGGAGMLPLVLLVLFALGVALQGYIRYRHGRQDEVMQLIAAAVATDIPLVPALKAYARDRPTRGQAQVVAIVAFNLLVFAMFIIYAVYDAVWVLVLTAPAPIITLAWWWFWRRRFDRELAVFTDRLEDGDMLTDAVRAVPTVVGPEARLAIAVGEATGRLGLALRAADRKRLTAAWMDVVPRLLYPFLVLFLVVSFTQFLMIMIIPKFKKIADEFGMPLPNVTRSLINIWDDLYWLVALMPLAVLGALFAVVLLIVNPAARWRTPIIGRLYRWNVQAQILRTLGLMIAARQTLPRALQRLADAPELPGFVGDKLETVLHRVEEGEPLAENLHRVGLLPGNMLPLLTTAERVGTLAPTLGELGEHLGGRALALVSRISLVTAPIFVVAIGAVVGFIAVGIFLPLVEMIEKLTP